MSDWERIFGYPKLWYLYTSVLKRGYKILGCEEVKDNVYRIETAEMILIINSSDAYTVWRPVSSLGEDIIGP